jgi:purine catabolism regulator
VTAITQPPPADTPENEIEGGVTVRAVLEMPAIRRGAPEVLAGGESLDRRIRWVHAGEVPNMATLLKGSELLLTTGMGVTSSPAQQRRFIAELSERGVVGVVIELGAAMKSIPKALIEAARKHRLPLVALHRPIRFVEVTERVHREIFDQGGALLRYGEELHQRFISLLLSGATVPELLSSLAQIANNPVVLEHADQGPVYLAPNENDEQTVLGAWHSVAFGGPEAVPSFVVEVPEEGGRAWGRLVLLGIDATLREHHRVAAERAVGLIAVSLLRDRGEYELTNRERSDFLARLQTEPGEPDEIERRAHELGFEARRRVLLPLAIRIGPETALPTGGGGDWERIGQDLRHDLASRHLPALVGSRDKGRELLLVIGLRSESERPRAADLAAELAAASASSRTLGNPRPPTVCVAAATSSWADVGAGLAAAQAGLPAAYHGPGRRWHDAANPDLDRLLWSLRENAELRRFVELRLGPLLSSDKPRDRQLRDTLVEYCNHAGRKTETAQALGIERQSLYYRLGRVEARLGVDLSDGETLLTIYLALWAQRYLSWLPGDVGSASRSRA